MLPPTILAEVFSYLNTREQCELRLASKQWGATATDVVFSRPSVIEENLGMLLPILEKYAPIIKDVSD